jgi:hypothetical protein
MPATLFHFIFSSVCALILLVLPGLALLRVCVPARRLTLLARITAAPGITVAFSVLLFVWFQILHFKLGPLLPWSMILVAVGTLVLQIRRRTHRVGKDEWWAGATLFALLSFLLLVRFNSTRDWIVPPGIDSAQHTVIVQLMLDHHGLFDSWAPYDDSETFTYHFGFHSITALFAWMTGAPPPYAVFVMARVIGLCAVAALFPLVRLWTRSAWGGVFAVAVWELYSRHLYFFDLPGRWTLLTGLAILPGALVLFDLFLRERSRSWPLGLLTTMTTAGLLLAQYKTTIIFVVLAASLVCAQSLRVIFSQPNARTRRSVKLLLRTFGVALLALLFVAPRLNAVLHAKTGQHLQRIVLEPAPMNPDAFGAPNLDAAGIFRTAFNTPQKVAGSLLSFLGGILIFVRRRRAIWFAVGWLVLALVMNPRLVGIDRAGVIDEIHWKFAVQTAIAVMAGLAVGLVFDEWGRRRSVGWNILMMFGTLLLALFGAARMQPVPQWCRFVLPEDLRLMSWMKEHLPAGEMIAARSFFDHGQVQGSDAAVWIPYFTRHRTNQTTLAAALEKAPPDSRESLRSFTRELYERDMSTPESARWIREKGFPWFYAGAIQPEVDAKLLEQIARNPAIEVAQSEGAARIYRVK